MNQNPPEPERPVESDSELEASTLINPPHPGPIPEVLRDRPGHAKPAAKTESGMVGMAKAWAVALDFVFSILAGGGLGWLIDLWRSSAPWGLLIGMALGFVVGFWRIIRTTQAQERDEAKRKRDSGRV